MAVKRVKDAEEMLATFRSQADPVLVELLRQLINSVKILSGDQSPLIR